MFTGIIQACVPVVEATTQPGLTTFVLEFPEKLIQNLHIGASIAVDGVCLTVVKITNNRVWFDAMDETRQKTTLGEITQNRRVNIERSATMGTEIGGHIVSGHVAGIAEIVHVDTPENNHIVTFRVPPAFMPYIFHKGFIALDGASLTIVDVDKTAATFSVWLIPETLRMTTFGFKQASDKVNIEIDSRTQMIVDTIERVLQEQQHNHLCQPQNALPS
ncbi:MAG: riboflavin synthase subunit alpha [Candidatus Kerfeldbacteria bacterium]|nr:riboflavin synthase subunit alpha [Candidatus Kerfeldbacteria bacterium]